MDKPTPRINSKRLPQYIGQNVRFTGKLLSVTGDKAIIESTDGGQVEVKLAVDSHLSDPYVEIIGNVTDEHSIKILTGMNMGSDLDLKILDDLTEAIHKFSGPFM